MPVALLKNHKSFMQRFDFSVEILKCENTTSHKCYSDDKIIRLLKAIDFADKFVSHFVDFGHKNNIGKNPI